jgi:tRNA (guanine-N7-)-methyltransferase
VRKSPRLSPEALAPFVLDTPAPGRGPETAPVGLIDFRALFGNDHPVEVEVGFGKGLFLVTAGQAYPGTNYFGVEIVRKYQLYTATRLARRGLRNVRVTCADARALVRDRVAEGAVRAVHLHFPDPWWKTRHHKRRVFTPEFAAVCARVLEPGGQLLVVTDVADYAAMVRETVAVQTRLVESEPPAEHEPTHAMDYLTNFERKYRQQGKAIYRMRFVKSEVVV